jgi:hypothetical protein
MAESLLEMARRHVANSERVIAEQERLLVTLRSGGLETADAEMLLKTYRELLELQRTHLRQEELRAARDDSVTVVYRWEVRDGLRKSGWRELAWMMTEDDAGTWSRAHATEIRRVEGSREERRDVDGRYPKI